MKGIFFSLILVFVVMFFIMFVAIQRSLISFFSTQKSVESRIDAILGFYDGIVIDSKKSSNIIGKRAISAATNFVITNGIPLNSSNDTIAELMFNGTLNGVPQGLMVSSTVNDWESAIESLGSLQGFRINLLIKNLLIQPSDSFHLSISYSISVNISDTVTKTNISKISNQSLLLSIENFEDPTYPLNSYGRLVNVIKKSPHWNNYSSTDLTNLNDDLNNSFYHPSLYGASFLDRLEGKYFVQTKYQKSNPIGLESFVNKDKILSVGLQIVTNATNIDYFYFSSSSVPAYFISGMPANFRLDNENTVESKTHLQIYNVTVI
jgi:hypothetical protein